MKRTIDLVVSVVGVTILAPLLAIISVLILLDDGRPVLFKQTRVGRNGGSFTVLKFRSMDSGSPGVPSHEASSLKVTRVGAPLRRFSLDELPQLVNIVRGEMAIVGPRPALVGQDDLVELRRASGALELRPGLTGLAQVKSYDGMDVETKARYDGEYCARLSLALDIKILALTVLYLMKPPPTY